MSGHQQSRHLEGPATPSRYVLQASRILPLTAAKPEQAVEALAIAEGRIVAAGSLQSAWSAIGSDAPRIDLGEATVLPGFVDAHIHLMGYALARRQLQIEHGDDLATVREALSRRVATASPDEWIVGRGWDHAHWGRWPGAADLDDVAGPNPVALTRKDGHALWLNSVALQRAGITADTPSPEGGEIELVDGQASGILKERAMDLARIHIPPPESPERQRALDEAWLPLWQAGITACHDMGYLGSGRLDLLDDARSLASAGRLGLRLVWYALETSLPEALARGLAQDRGDEGLRFGGLKLFLDGTLGSQTADMLAPYEAQADNRGIATLDYDRFCALALEAARAGLPTAVHAIGDAANRKALDGFAWVTGQLGSGAPRLLHRIEHAQVLHPDDIGRFRRQDVTVSMQPIHMAADWPVADRFWGARARHAYAWRSVLDSGARLAFGSDAPIESISVIEGIATAVGRRDASGQPADGWYPAECLSAIEALSAYTLGAARAVGFDDRLGSLETGKLADLVVLDGDPTRVSDREIRNRAVNGTMIQGRWMWRREG
jgi:predicted amidohydrolase YtcJ